MKLGSRILVSFSEPVEYLLEGDTKGRGVVTKISEDGLDFRFDEPMRLGGVMFTNCHASPRYAVDSPESRGEGNGLVVNIGPDVSISGLSHFIGDIFLEENEDA